MDKEAKFRIPQAFQELEVARCEQKWADIPDLAKKYKKCHPQESVLEFTARMETEYALLSQRMRRHMLGSSTSGQIKEQKTINGNSITDNASKKSWTEEELEDIHYQLDDPNQISFPLIIPASEVQLLVARLLDIIQRQKQLGDFESPDDWQAQFSRIILARIYLETGRYDKALEWLQNLALRVEDVQRGYGLVLFVQARVIKGICLESQGYDVDALDSYFAALKVFEEHPDERNKALSHWIEECLYRSILMQLREKGPVKQTLHLMRSYLSHCIHHWPTEYRIYKRWIIFRHYVRYLTRAFQKGIYVSVEDGNTASSTVTIGTIAFSSATAHLRTAAVEETMSIMTQFRRLLSVFIHRYQKINTTSLQSRILEFAHLLTTAHDAVGWTIGTEIAMTRGQNVEVAAATAEIATATVKIPSMTKYLRCMFQFLTKAHKLIATQSGSNSLCMARHLTHIALRLSEHREAELAFSMYLEALGVPKSILNNIRYGMASYSNFKHFNLNRETEKMQGEDGADIDTITETIQRKLQDINRASLAFVNQSNVTIGKTVQKLYQLSQSQHSVEQQALQSHAEFFENTMEGDSVLTNKSTASKRKAIIGSYENDNELDIARIILQAAQQLFAHYQKRYSIVCILTDIAVSLLEQMPELLKKKKMTQWKSLLALGCRLGGSAYSLCALAQSHNDTRRTELLTEASLSLNKANEVDPQSWQVVYELALLQTTMGQISAAIHSLNRALQLRHDFLPNWHLLSLLYQTRQQHPAKCSNKTNRATKSLELLQAGIDMNREHLLTLNDNTYTSVVAVEAEEGQTYLQQAIELIKAEMAKIQLVETTEGSEAALTLYANLFHDYARLSDRVGLPTIAAANLSSSPSKTCSAAIQPQTRSRANSASRMTFHSSGLNSSSAISFPDSNASHTERTENSEQQQVGETAGQNSTIPAADSTATLGSIQSEKTGIPANDRASNFSKRRQRSRSTFSQQFKDDPLISFSSEMAASEKSRSNGHSSMAVQPENSRTSDKKVKRERRSTFLGSSRPSIFRGSNSSSSHTRKQQQQQQQQQQNSYTTSADNNPAHAPLPTILDNKEHIHHDRIYHREWQELLVKVWVMVSATYTRLKNAGEAIKAIEEAKQTSYDDNAYACIYHQLGQVHLLQYTDATGIDCAPEETAAYHQQAAEDAFKKALIIDPDHVETHIALSSLYMEQAEYVLAERLLRRTTKDFGWNRAEAWFLLGKIYENYNDKEEAKHCFLYALQLNEVSPALHATTNFPRFV